MTDKRTETSAAVQDIREALASQHVDSGRSLTQTLAVACRILAANGHGSGLAGQMTARGDAPGTMWTLPYGMGFEEVTASDYLLVDNDLKVIDGEGTPNPANRFHLHVYAVRDDIDAIVHTHPLNCSALSMIGEPLKPMHMDTSMFYGDVAFLPRWPGIPFGDEEGEIISEALGDKNAILLAHHGQLCAAPTVEAACVMGVFIERAAEMQLKAMAAGDIREIEPDLGREAHDWRHAPEAMRTTFEYFARRALTGNDDCLR